MRSVNYYNYRIFEDGSILGLRGKFVKPQLSNGYFRFMFNTPDGKKRWLVHRLMMHLFVGQSDLDVNHKNGDKTDNRLSNLEYTTRQENIRHAWLNGLAKARYGKDMHTTKISDDVIHAIKQSNESNRKLAKIYNISQGSVGRIKNNKQRKCHKSR